MEEREFNSIRKLANVVWLPRRLILPPFALSRRPRKWDTLALLPKAIRQFQGAVEKFTEPLLHRT
jgi:hypothetical protein